jgi:hypothetical protein
MSIVQRYLQAVSSLDWDTAYSCLAEDVKRVGPFGDAYSGRDHYLDSLRSIMEGLSGYRMDLGRVVTSDDGGTITAELSETVEMDGRAVVTPECLLFDLDQDGLIVGIRIYIQKR